MVDPKSQIVQRCCWDFEFVLKLYPDLLREEAHPLMCWSRRLLVVPMICERRRSAKSCRYLPYTFCTINLLNPSLHSGFTPPCQQSSLAICADNVVSTKPSTPFLLLIRSLHFCIRLCFNEIPSRLLHCGAAFPSFPFTCPEPELKIL